MKFIILFTALLLSLAGVASGQATLKAKMYVHVDVAGVPATEVTRLSSRYAIDESGNLTLPLLESPVKVSGLNGTKAAAKLTAAYKAAGLYNSPIFTVTSAVESESEAAIARRYEERARIREEAMRRDIERSFADKVREEDEIRVETKVVHVTGYAEKKGKYKLTHNMTIQTLLAECGGDSKFGSAKRFILKRGGNNTEYNFKKDASSLQISLKPGDFVEIPEGTGIWGKN